MLRSNKFTTFLFSFKALPVVLAVISIISCSLVDLRPVGVTVVPGEAEAILPDRETSVELRFDAEPVHVEAEGALSVSSPDGSVEGSYLWDGNTLSFAPRTPWSTGIRYVLSGNGSVRMADGRSARIERTIPFYAVRRGGLVRLVSFSPGTGAVFPHDGSLSLEFSAAMDRSKTEQAFSLNPNAACVYSWNEESTVLTVATEDGLPPCETWTWSIAGAIAQDGTPQARKETGWFTTTGDLFPPAVLRAAPGRWNGSGWIETGSALDDAECGDAILVFFSEAVDQASVEGAVGMEKGIRGTVDVYSSDRCAFVPDESFAPGASMVLVVGTELKDMAGIAMASEYRAAVEISTPYLAIASIEDSFGSRIDAPAREAVLDAGLVNILEGSMALTVEFSADIALVERIRAADAVRLSPFFPTGLASVKEVSVSWTANDAVRIVWEGLTPSVPGVDHFYVLAVTGGTSGVVDETGAWMESDALVYVRVRE